MRVTSEWNGLPDGVKEAKKVADFKRLYRRHRADTERKPLGNTRLVVQQEQEHPRQGSTLTAEDHLNQDQEYLSLICPRVNTEQLFMGEE